MLTRILATTCLLLLAGCDRPPAVQPSAPSAPQDHLFGVYGANGQTFLVDSKTGDVWVYDATGKHFTTLSVDGISGADEQYNPQTKKLEPIHKYPSWFHPTPQNDPLVK